MNLQTSKPLLLALMLIASSLAGCLGNTDEGDDSLGTVMVSTYHVQQLAEAVGGDLVDVQLLSPSNIPVHDYEPTAADVITLGTADLFLYHLNRPSLNGSPRDIVVVREVHGRSSDKVDLWGRSAGFTAFHMHDVSGFGLRATRVVDRRR